MLGRQQHHHRRDRHRRRADEATAARLATCGLVDEASLDEIIAAVM
jgi:hypothetical protein